MKQVVAVRYDQDTVDAIKTMAEHRQITTGEMYRRIAAWALSEKHNVCNHYAVDHYDNGRCGECGALK